MHGSHLASVLGTAANNWHSVNAVTNKSIQFVVVATIQLYWPSVNYCLNTILTNQKRVKSLDAC